MPTPTTLKASEFSISLTFYGPEYGAFPATTANTPLTTEKFNSIKFNGGEESKDFKAGQEIISLKRFIGQDSSISGQLNLKSNAALIKKYQTEGPLVKITISGDNPIDAGTELVAELKGKMKVPDVDFISNPGIIDFEIESYGETPLFTIT